MNSTRRTALGLVMLALAALPLTGFSYNRFVGQEEAIKAQWAQVQNQLQRRNDLIPNLVETVKGYATHEESVYKDIADARSRLLAARSPEETIQAANQQTSALGRLLAVVENYPQLKANEQFNRLMDELSGTENRIAVERKRYNDAVQAYNTSRRQFPGNVTRGCSASRSIRSSKRRQRRSRCRASISRGSERTWRVRCPGSGCCGAADRRGRRAHGTSSLISGSSGGADATPTSSRFRT